MLIFLLTKKPVCLLAEQVCTEPRVDHGPGEKPGPCTRPIWADGTVDGVRFDLCSQCWHQWRAFRLALERAICECGLIAEQSLLCEQEDCPHRLDEPDEWLEAA